MRTRLTVVMLLVVIASLLLAAPSEAKLKMKPLVVTETMTAGLPDHPDTWFGSVEGGINGTQEGWGCTFDPGPGTISPLFLGGISPGYSLITTDRGSVTFYKMDVYIEGTWEFRNVGFVTSATGDWEYLLGWTTYAYGFTPDPETWGDSEPDIEGDQLTCIGYRVFLPPLPAKWGKLGVW